MIDYLLNQLHPALFGLIAGAVSGIGIFAAMFKGKNPEDKANDAGKDRFRVFNIIGWVIAVASMVFYLIFGVIIPYLGEVAGKHVLGMIVYAVVMLFFSFLLQRIFGPRKKTGSSVSMQELMVMAHNRRTGGVYLLAEREVDGKVVRLYSNDELYEVAEDRSETLIPESPERDAIAQKVRETIK